MAYFTENTEAESQRLDWQILQSGWVSVYLSQDILNRDLEWFSNVNFQLVEFDCSTWTDNTDLHKDLSRKLRFPEYYGENLDALNDCLIEMNVPGSGIVVAFRKFTSVDKSYQHPLLDVFANASRRHILSGKKLITLIQVDDTSFSINSVGSCPVTWNRSEWLDKDRIRR